MILSQVTSKHTALQLLVSQFWYYRACRIRTEFTGRKAVSWQKSTEKVNEWGRESGAKSARESEKARGLERGKWQESERARVVSRPAVSWK